MPTKEEQQKLLEGILVEKAKKRALEGEAVRKLADQQKLANQLKHGPPPVPVPAAAPAPAAVPVPTAVPTPTPSVRPTATPAPPPKPAPVAAAAPTPAPAPTSTTPARDPAAKEPPAAPPGQAGLKQYMFVVDGAELKCNKGSAPAALHVVAKRPAVGGKPGANITDNAPLVNIPSFGTCKVTKKACVPAPTGWQEFFRSTRVGDAPALLDGCTNPCAIGGKIKITNPGQTGLIAPLDMIPAAPLTDKNWTCGARPAGALPFGKLQAMPGVKPEGDPIVKSNNPETFTSTGVLAYHDGEGPRGGGDKKLSKFVIFISHQNAPKAADRYVQVIAVNPGKTPVTISAQGSALTGADRRAFGGYTGRSPYYLVSDDMLVGRTPTKFSGTIPPGGAVQLYRTVLKGGGGVEGVLRTEVSGGEGVYTYVVATSTPGLAEAVQLARGPKRQMAAGNIKPQSEDDPATAKNESAFGTEAGVYSASKYTGNVAVPLPECDAYLGLSINEASYKPVPDSARTQSVGPLAGAHGESLALDDSSLRTHGNYGHEYDLTLVLRNPQSTPRTVRVWFSHTAAYVSPTPNPNQRKASFYFNGSVQFGEKPAQVVITPGKPTQELTPGPIVVGPGQEVRVPLHYFPPGMSSAGQQLILESKK